MGRLLADPDLRARLSLAGRERANEFGWARVTAKVDDYYGFVIRRAAAHGALPAHFTAPMPPSPRTIGQLTEPAALAEEIVAAG
jgi:hypothetical protein